MNFVSFFNTVQRDEVWAKYKKRIQENFEVALIQFSAMHKHHIKCKNQISGWERLTCGYRGIGFNNGIPPKIRTKDTMGLSLKETVQDHVIGATLIGKTVSKEFTKQKFDIKFMVDKWLYKNLYLWSTIRVTKEEHQVSNIARNSNTLKEKIKLKHYISISELVSEE